MKTKKTSAKHGFEHRILPLYNPILKKLLFYYLLIFPFFLLLPMFFAVVITTLIILGILNEKRKSSKNGLIASPFSLWKNYGYRQSVLCIIMAGAVLVLLSINIFIQPLIFKLVVTVFYLIF